MQRKKNDNNRCLGRWLLVVVGGPLMRCCHEQVCSLIRYQADRLLNWEISA